jgi:hypothetical protein
MRVDFAVPRLWYSEVEAELTPTLENKEKRRGRKDACCFPRAGVSSYLCRLCTMCVNPSMQGVVSTPWESQFQGHF